MNYEKAALRIIKKYITQYGVEHPETGEAELIKALGNHTQLALNVGAYISESSVQKTITQEDHEAAGFFQISAFGGAFKVSKHSGSKVTIEVDLTRSAYVNVEALLAMIENALDAKTVLMTDWIKALAITDTEAHFEEFAAAHKLAAPDALVDEAGVVERGKILAKAELLDTLLGRINTLQLRK